MAVDTMGIHTLETTARNVRSVMMRVVCRLYLLDTNMGLTDNGACFKFIAQRTRAAT